MPPNPDDPAGEPTQGTAPHALVVDDDPDFQAAMQDLVRTEGFSVGAATSLAQARELLAERPPDLVLVDLSLPDGSGLDMLRDSDGRPSMAVVVITGHATVGSAVEALRAGATDYLTKPVVPDELAAAIRARLRRAEASAGPGARRKPGTEATPSQLEPLGLTPREAEVLFWVARGKTNDEIATVLGIGLTTVKKHLESTYAKLGVENRTTAAAMALERMASG